MTIVSPGYIYGCLSNVAVFPQSALRIMSALPDCGRHAGECLTEAFPGEQESSSGQSITRKDLGGVTHAGGAGTTMRMKIYSPFEGGWRDSAGGCLDGMLDIPRRPQTGATPFFQGGFSKEQRRQPVSLQSEISWLYPGCLTFLPLLRSVPGGSHGKVNRFRCERRK